MQKQLFRKILRAIYDKITGRPPDWAAEAISRYPFIEPYEHYHLQRVAHDLLAKTGGVVFAGPLAGMKIPLDTPLADLPMYVLGCYEMEMHPVLSRVICSPPPLIIDIGSAFGYYTVGLACQTKNTRIIGFEADKEIHWDKARQLAELNEVSHRIEQRGYCDTQALSEAAEEGCFIICDCEGGEVELLNPEKIPALKKSEILCEVHEFYAPKATAILIDRFKATHRAELLCEIPRNPNQYRILDSISDAYKLLAVRESRHVGKNFTTLRYLHLAPLG
jgi:hypothetical protein